MGHDGALALSSGARPSIPNWSNARRAHAASDVSRLISLPCKWAGAAGVGRGSRSGQGQQEWASRGRASGPGRCSPDLCPHVLQGSQLGLMESRVTPPVRGDQLQVLVVGGGGGSAHRVAAAAAAGGRGEEGGDREHEPHGLGLPAPGAWGGPWRLPGQTRALQREQEGKGSACPGTRGAQPFLVGLAREERGRKVGRLGQGYRPHENGRTRCHQRRHWHRHDRGGECLRGRGGVSVRTDSKPSCAGEDPCLVVSQLRLELGDTGRQQTRLTLALFAVALLGLQRFFLGKQPQSDTRPVGKRKEAPHSTGNSNPFCSKNPKYHAKCLLHSLFLGRMWHSGGSLPPNLPGPRNRRRPEVMNIDTAQRLTSLLYTLFGRLDLCKSSSSCESSSSTSLAWRADLFLEKGFALCLRRSRTLGRAVLGGAISRSGSSSSSNSRSSHSSGRRNSFGGKYKSISCTIVSMIHFVQKSLCVGHSKEKQIIISCAYMQSKQKIYFDTLGCGISRWGKAWPHMPRAVRTLALVK